MTEFVAGRNRFHRHGPSLIALGYTAALTLHRTSHEIEVKLAVPNLLSLVDQIRRLGTACIGRVFEQNVVFDLLTRTFGLPAASCACGLKRPRELTSRPQAVGAKS